MNLTITDIGKLFKHSMNWNTVEAFLYQTLFLIHYGLLFYFIGATHYGIFSTGISILYAWLMIGNLGFDYTLAPFFLTIKSSKDSAEKYLGIQWLIQLGIISISSCLFYFFFPSVMPEQFTNNSLIRLIMIFLLISESIKKSLRTVLQLAFKNKITALVEVTTITLYMIIVWTFYFLYRQFSLELLIVPLAITSPVSAGVLSFFVYKWYIGLPEKKDSPKEPDIRRRIFLNRLYATLYGTTQQLFSSNILVPAIAYNSGMRQAGVFNMLSTVVYSITHIFHKMSASSSQAAFAWSKNQSIAFKKEMFGLVWGELSKIASIAGIVLVVNQLHMSTSSLTIASRDIILQGYLYIGILIIEFFAVAYEKFYLNEEKADRLAALQIFVILLASTTIWFGRLTGTTLILELLFTIRCFSFILLMIQSFRIWGLKPQWNISRKTLLYGLPLALCLYGLLKIAIRSLK